MTTYGIKKVFLSLMFGIALCLLVNLAAFAADENAKINFGTEIDMLPFINGGYYTSNVIGYNHYNVRLITAKTEVPGFATPDGYENWKLKNVTAVILDYFPNENREGLWFAGGFEHWKSEIRSETTGETGEFSQNILTVGSGYVYNFTKHWYINPWVALHYNLSDKTVTVGSEELKLKDIMYEASIKFGYRF